MLIVGNTTIAGDDAEVYGPPFYWKSINDFPQEVKCDLTAYNRGVTVSDNNNNGHMVGIGSYVKEDDTRIIVPFYWSSVNDFPQILKYDSSLYPTVIVARGINNKGNIVGLGRTAVDSAVNLYWPSINDFPQVLALKTSSYYKSVEILKINDNGNLIGFGTNTDSLPTSLYWRSINDTAEELAIGSTVSGAAGFGINNNGSVVGNGFTNSLIIAGFVALYWDSVNALPQVLKYNSELAVSLLQALDINNNGNIVGVQAISNLNRSEPLYWESANASPQVLKFDYTIYSFGIVLSCISDAPFTPTPAPTPISNICFPAGTPVKTDQGIIKINELDPRKHTITSQPILQITRTTTLDNYLISFDEHSLERNVPSSKTIMTKDHKVMFEGRLVPAYRFLDFSDKVKKVKYTGEILYNVLLSKYGTINVNNLVCETLHPDNLIAKLCMRDTDQQHALVCEMNYALENKDFISYKDVVSRITHRL
jgi:hypothetical protein